MRFRRILEMPLPIPTPILVLALLASVPGVVGHTWIEQLRNINADGKYVGEYGYPRGMVSKTDPGFTGMSMNWELPQYEQEAANGPYITDKSTLCHPQQRKQQQSSDKYPRLQATPGGFIAMRYTENGHVTKPNNQLGKPEKAGTVFVYGTTQPIENEKLANVLQWSKDGQGGDKRGILIGMNDYDDGRCYEVNETPESKQRAAQNPNFAMGQVSNGPGNYPLMCETDVALPKDVATGKPYTIYWVWQWNTKPNADPGLPKGKDEYYSTCIDVDVVDAIKSSAEAKFALGQQDAMAGAVQAFADRTAIITDPLKHEMGPVFNSTPTAPGVPTLTKRPGGDKPTAAPSQGPRKSGSGFITLTKTVRVTVTAAAPTQAATKRAEHVARHVQGDRSFRGRYKRD